jgi:DNA gyrase subunit A
MTQFAKETLPVSLEEEMRRSYLDYAMSVIVGRALPDARDGLKPVHRRVLFAMHELNNDWNRPYKKSARIVGDVIGKYHPHGDQSVYDTIVRMAQDFSMRHMLVDGQGNFGSVDGDNAAAMRYTEIRLAKIAHEMLADIDKETVDFGPNYDGSEKEPLVLPSKLPNLLVNGSGGIAVGMATNIPPHNLNEVVDACLHLLRNPEASIDELMEIIPAPDFPTAGIIYGINGVKDGYRTGRGRVVMRAKCHFEDIDRGQRQAIIVDELPYQVNKKTLQERMAELVHEKKIEGISHIQDESDKSGMRLVIELKRGEVPEVVLNNLYKQTQLQDTFGINMVALIDGQPKLCNLKDLISVFLQHRREVVTRRTVFTLRKARERGHVLEGLAVALANIDDFIAIIRNAPTPPVAKAELMARPWDSKLVREMLTRTRADGGVVNADDYRPDGLEKDYGMGSDGLYRLSDTQAQEILQMRLQRLTGLEQDKIVAEYKDVMAEIEDLLDILAGRNASRPSSATSSPPSAGIRPEQDRRAPQPDRTQRLRPEHRGPDHPDRHGGDAESQRLHQEPAPERIPGPEARRPRQAGHGDQGRRLGRPALHRQHARLHPVLLEPRPALLAQGLGGAAGLARLARPPDRQHVPAAGWREDHRRAAADRREAQLPADQYVFMATQHGHRQEDGAGRVQQPAQGRHHRGGPGPGDFLIGAALTDGQHDVMLFSDGGKAVRFDENDVRPMGRNARGVRGMMLEDGQSVIAMLVAERRTAKCADRHRERLRQAHQHHRVHPPRPRHQGHDRDPAERAQRQGRGRHAGACRRRDHADHRQGRAGAHPRQRNPRTGSRHAKGSSRLIGLDEGSRLSGLQRIVENDANATDTEAPADESTDGTNGGDSTTE